ncbi:hypothetical protein ACHAWF_012285, partial [Thalassiosira exigua]
SLLRFKFDDFAPESGCDVYSDVADSHGNKWKLCILPGGDESDDEEEEEGIWVSVFLFENTFILRDSTGKVFKEVDMGLNTFKGTQYFGESKFLERLAILDGQNNILSGGAFIFDVLLQIKPEAQPQYGSLAEGMFELLDDNEFADVLFDVDDEKFHAHKAILKMKSSVLLDFCEGGNVESPITIDGIEPDIFRVVLRYVYGKEVPNEEMTKKSAKEILDAANRLGVVQEISRSNGGLIRELTKALNNVKTVSVIDLRKQLHEKGLDLDGSKEMLISRLEEAKSKRRRTAAGGCSAAKGRRRHLTI